MTHPTAAPLLSDAEGPPVEVLRADGRAPVVVACEHASATIPASLSGLGLSPAASVSHAAWDPGARDLAMALSERLDATLVAARFSRLVHDCNRPAGAETAMPAQSERIAVPGNRDLGPDDRAARAAALYQPFHDALASELARRDHPALVTIHSFTPIYNGTPRSVELGLLFDPRDDRLGRAMLSVPDLPANSRANEPYGPGDGVLHTLERHALPHGLLNVMVEVRNDLLTTPADVAAMADTLARLLAHGLSRFDRLRATT